MNNSWNQFIYKCWSPIYDRMFNSGIFLKARKEVFQDITLAKGSKILFVGVGTGADLPYFMNKEYKITAIDYSEDMLHMAKKRFADSTINFKKMDAQNLQFEDESFDFIVASLILSVVPDPQKAINEMIRVLNTDGQFLIFDKFASKDNKTTFSQKILRPVIQLLGTDIGVEFYQVFKSMESRATITNDQNVIMKGLYRKINGVKKEHRI